MNTQTLLEIIGQIGITYQWYTGLPGTSTPTADTAAVPGGWSTYITGSLLEKASNTNARLKVTGK